jgi:ParB family chromosome partitioning protein
MTTYKKGTLYNLDLNVIQPDPNQPRKVIDPQALDELVESIRQHGILQPVLFRKGDGGEPILVAGERRLEAAKKAGLTVLPGICVEGKYGEIALVENLLRQDLTTVEEAEALQRLAEEQKYTQEQLGAVISKARQTITDILTLNRLPQEIRDECRGDRTISRAALLDIARKKQERSMLKAYYTYKDKLQKAKQPRKKGAVNPAQALFNMIDKTMTRIRMVDTTDWSDEEKANLLTSLNGLKKQIDAALAAPPPQPKKQLA